MTSVARQRFEENKNDVDQLWEIHQEIAGDGRGRKYGVDVINRAAIIFVTACWESFIEDLATESFDFLLANVPNAMAIPIKVRELASRPIFEQKDSRKIWDLADSGWRALLAAHRNAAIEKWVGTLNTPKTGQVNQLFEDLLGIKTVSTSWRWQAMPHAKAEAKLDDYITIRGNIAHRTEHDETVYKNWSEDYLNHVHSLVEKTEVTAHKHLLTVTGKAPW